MSNSVCNCYPLTLYSYRPSLFRGPMNFITGSIFSGMVRLYWPIDLLDDWGTALHPSSDKPTDSSPSIQSINPKPANADIPKDAGAWFFGQRGQALIGIYCSQATAMDWSKGKGDSIIKMKNADGKETEHPVPVSQYIATCIEKQERFFNKMSAITV